jgi:cellulose synthase/poly-beta-1,6-N-acetylglucosamine synthase-like glycosyltransferase
LKAKAANSDFAKDQPVKIPFVSVIMPCFNAAATIGVAVESVLVQDFADFELIVVDDGSKDGSVGAAHEMATRDGRIRVICQANAGPSAARNRGIQQSRGAVLAFLDADDRWMPTALSTHVSHFARDGECGVSFARIRFFDPSMTWAGRFSASISNVSLAQVLGENPICTTSNLVVRRQVFDEVDLFDRELTHAEDQEWVARVLATSRWRVAGLPDVLVHYRTSPGGLSADLDRMSAGWDAVMRRVHDYAPEQAVAAEAEATALFNRYLARRALRTGQVSDCLRPFLRAWRASPLAMLTRQPRRTALTTLGVMLALLPGNPARALLSR